ncbi:hypothetical protein FACS189434_13520 [Bacteroidia bacterium]|nr:hypothetical protein FACS189434_13520 [Bacteroidia bacterium]
MAYRAKLTVNNIERELLACDRNYFRANPDDPMLLSQYDYRFACLTPQQLHNRQYRLLDDFDQTLPWCRKPRQTVFGGLFNVVTESTGDDDFFYYWFKEGYYLHGILEFYNAMDEDLPFQRIEFWDAWVTTIDEQMSSWSNMPMLLHFKISAATVRVNKTVKFQQNWFVTDIDEKPVTVFERTEETEDKKITKLYWVDAETGEEIETMENGQKAKLCFETQGYRKGEVVKAKVKWSDERKFADNSTEMTFSGKADENGKAVSEETYEMDKNNNQP